MRSRRFPIWAFIVFGVLAFASWAAAATTNFTVTNNGMSAYVIGGVNNPTLTLTRGETYTFTVNTFGHPFWITTARGAGDTSSNAFNSGVTNNGASPGTLTFVVPASAPATLFYQCSFHDVMGGTLNIVAAPAAPTPAPSLGVLGLLGLMALLLLTALSFLRRRTRA